MLSEFEIHIFSRELCLLLDQLNRCPDLNERLRIYEEFMLNSSIIDSKWAEETEPTFRKIIN